MKPLWALLPVKDFARAKSRLAPVLDEPARTALARGLCEHALKTLAACPGIDGVLVLSDCPEVLALARRHGAAAVREDDRPTAARGLGARVEEGLAILEDRGARAALVMMADLPLLRVSELQRLLALLPDHDLVVAPDLREQNTNALLLPLAGRARTAFGTGDSFRLHCAQGPRVAVLREPGLGFDIDEPEDYQQLLATLTGRAAPFAPGTVPGGSGSGCLA